MHQTSVKTLLQINEGNQCQNQGAISPMAADVQGSFVSIQADCEA